jgi:simple sugar transport system permease protein
MGLIPLLRNSVRIMTPFLLAATGGLFTELTGVLNIALEGLMTVAAFFSVLTAALTHSVTLGLLAGVLSAVGLSLLFGFASLRLRANVFIAGIATNLMAAGIASVLALRFFGHKGVHSFPSFPPGLFLPNPAWAGALGDIFLGHGILTYAAWLVALASYVLLYRSPLGLRLRATGSNSRALGTLGMEPRRYRYLALIFCGFACGLAGSSLSLNLEAYVPNVVAGRGWIALVIIYLGNRKLVGIALASLLFGLAESLSNYAQGLFNLPANVILSLPYVVSLLALIIYSMWARRSRGIHT